jgi:hypothetical protein
MVDTYWKIGQYIIEFVQGGNLKAQYGAKLLERLAKDLSLLHGKGFSLSNLKRMRQFFIYYPISATLSHQLSWSNFIVKKWYHEPLITDFINQLFEFCAGNIDTIFYSICDTVSHKLNR